MSDTGGLPTTGAPETSLPAVIKAKGTWSKRVSPSRCSCQSQTGEQPRQRLREPHLVRVPVQRVSVSLTLPASQTPGDQRKQNNTRVQERGRGGPHGEGGEGHQGEEDPELPEEQDDRLLQQG